MNNSSPPGSPGQLMALERDEDDADVNGNIDEDGVYIQQESEGERYL